MIGPLVAMYACTGLGLYFTPAVAREVAAYWSVLLLVGAFAILLGACGSWTLSHHRHRPHHGFLRERAESSERDFEAHKPL
jgi:hypothetical protein